MSKKKNRSKKASGRQPAKAVAETPSRPPEVSWQSLFPRNPGAQVLIISIFVFLVYIPSLSVPWHFDDYFAIVDKQEHRSLDGVKLILRDFIHRGVVRLSYALDWHVSDRLDLYETRTEGGRPGYQSPLIYHISSVAYHLLTVAGVYLLVRKVAVLFAARETNINEPAPGRPIYLPAITALLYGILPINTEAVTYLSGRASVLATGEYVFGIWSVLIAARRFGLLDERLRGRSIRDYMVGACALVGTAACFVLGIGTKEIIVTMPVVGVLILALLIAHRLSLRTAIVRLVPACTLLGLLLVGFFTYRIIAMGGIIGIREAQSRSSWVNLLSQIAVVSLYYIPRQLCLRPLCIDPQVPVIQSIKDPRLIFGVLILGGLVMLGVLCVRRAPLITIGLAWYFISLAPTSSIIPLNDLAAERHTYLPNVGFVLAVVALGAAIRQRWEMRGQNRATSAKVFGVVILCIFVFEAILTVQRNLLYTDKIKFWEDAARLSPGKERVFHHLAKEYMEAGIPQKATVAYHAALEINPYLADAANNLGLIYMKDFKEYGKAAWTFEHCIERWPEWDNPWINLGTCYLLDKEFAKADELAQRWLTRDPNSVYAKLLMANSLYMQGRIDEAETEYLEILKTYGENTSALDNLASIAHLKGDNTAAQGYKQRADTVRQKEDFKPIEVHGKRDTIQADRF